MSYGQMECDRLGSPPHPDCAVDRFLSRCPSSFQWERALRERVRAVFSLRTVGLSFRGWENAVGARTYSAGATHRGASRTPSPRGQGEGKEEVILQHPHIYHGDQSISVHTKPEGKRKRSARPRSAFSQGAWRLGCALLLLMGITLRADRPPGPFGLNATLRTQGDASLVRFEFLVPADHVLYAERLKFETEDGAPLTPSKIPDPVVARDKATGHESKLYDRSFAAEFRLSPLPASLLVKFQGCSNSACYFPEKRWFEISGGSIHPKPEAAAEVGGSEPAPLSAGAADWMAEASHFKVLARESGYLTPRNFLSFLVGSTASKSALSRYKELGLGTTLLFILLGGVGLNLTPCVLPLIPINLAIIGAGGRARTRRQGFALGAIYGAGMALAYGALGLVVVLTGSKFGTLNSSVWFNAVIALVFVALALGMFDLLQVDFSRFRGGPRSGPQSQASRGLTAFTMGVVAAMLAGACVAPVVISVLLLSTQFYSHGTSAGLLLPFLLGLGMALPWPFAAAGLSFLPKPGKWMTWIKYAFGVVILTFAAYYGHLAYSLMESRRQTTQLADAPTDSSVLSPAPNQSLAQALREAREQGRTVLVDFAASWCKNCVAMDHTVFNQSTVQRRLNDLVVVRYEAERPNDSPAREVLDHFGVMGLPTYLLLKPKD